MKNIAKKKNLPSIRKNKSENKIKRILTKKIKINPNNKFSIFNSNFLDMDDSRFREIAETGQLRKKLNYEIIRKSLLKTLQTIYSLKLSLKEVHNNL